MTLEQEALRIKNLNALARTVDTKEFANIHQNHENLLAFLTDLLRGGDAPLYNNDLVRLYTRMNPGNDEDKPVTPATMGLIDKYLIAKNIVDIPHVYAHLAQLPAQKPTDEHAYLVTKDGLASEVVAKGITRTAGIPELSFTQKYAPGRQLQPVRNIRSYQPIEKRV